MSEQKATILVTGASGRLGYPVAKRLAESFTVVGFDRRAPSSCVSPASMTRFAIRSRWRSRSSASTSTTLPRTSFLATAPPDARPMCITTMWLRELTPAGDQVGEPDPHELMRLGEQPRSASKAPAPMPVAEPAKGMSHEHMKG